MSFYSDQIQKEIAELDTIQEQIVETNKNIEKTIELIESAENKSARQTYLGKFERLNETLDVLEGHRSEKSRSIMRIRTFRVSGLTKNMKHDQE